jgi:hypothetical protein
MRSATISTPSLDSKYHVNRTYISNVELADAPVVPAVADSHKSYETSATRPEEAEEYAHVQAVGMDVMLASVFPRPIFRSMFASGWIV